MIIGIAADHRGYELKKKIIKYLEKKNIKVIDYGTDSGVTVDYIDYAKLLCKGINEKKVNYGILICGTGIGMSIAANKINGIICAKVDTEEEAYYAKSHNNANIISISSKKNILIVKDIIDKYLKTDFSNEERHIKRIKKIKSLEKSSKKQTK